MNDSIGISEEQATSSPVPLGYSWPAVLIDPRGLGQIQIHLAVIHAKGASKQRPAFNFIQTNFEPFNVVLTKPIY